MFVTLADIVNRMKDLYFTERKATRIVILYVQFITFSLTFHLWLDLNNCLFFSGVSTDILCVFLISPMHFSCPICCIFFQFTTHQHLLNSTDHATPHSAISFIPLLNHLSSDQISLSAPVLA